MPRPKKDPNEKSSERVMLYTTPEKREELKTLAKRYRMTESKCLELALDVFLAKEQHFVYTTEDSTLRGAMMTGSLAGGEIIQEQYVPVVKESESDMTRLKVEVESVESQIPTSSVHELTRDEIQTILTEYWGTGDISALVQQRVEKSIYGLLNADGKTELLRSDKKERPYVCPFRGPQYRYGSVKRLVETAIPWLVHRYEWEENTKNQLAQKQEPG